MAKHKSMVFTLGPTGLYCSVASLSQRKLSWWSNWGSPYVPDGNVVKMEEIRKQLRERHGTWKDPVIQHIMDDMTTDRVYPVWTTPSLPHWGRGGAVLLGDAAHTLQATSGNGANQALEDSVTFCLLLSHYISEAGTAAVNAAVRKRVELAAKGLYEIRSSRVANIRDRMRYLYLTKRRIDDILLEYLWYIFIYLCTNFAAISECFFCLPGNSVIGFMPTEHEWDPEENVKKNLQNMGH